jgi:PAS domain S-box-containing protein
MASASVSLDRGLLPRVARAMTTSLGLGDVLAAASRAAAELVPDSLALIWVQHEDRLVLRAAAGVLNRPCTGLATTLAVGEGLVGAAGLARDVVIVEEPAADPRARDTRFLQAEGVRMFVGVPLAARHGRVGVLAVFSRRPRRPSPGTLDALGVLTTQAALAIESVRLFADTERRRRSAEALASVSQALAHSLDPRQVAHLIADNVLALLRARDVTLFEVQPQTGNLVSVAFAGEGAAGLSHPLVMPPGVGASGRAVATRREVFTPDILNAPGVIHTPELRAAIERAGYRAVVAVPLLVNGEPIGALAVAAGRGRGVDEESRQLLGAFADQAAVALNNARLFAAERAARAEAETAERRVRDLVHGVDAIVTEVEIATRRVLFVNGRVETLLGYPVEQWLTDPSFWRSRVHPDDRARVFACSDREIAAGRDWAQEYRMEAADGRVVWVRDSVTFRGDRLHCLKVDITERKRTEALLAGEKRVLEMIAAGEALPTVLDALCRTVEAQREGMHCSVLLVEGDRLCHGAAPSLPAGYVAVMDGIVGGARGGPSGLALAQREPMIVEDIATDARWRDQRELALTHGLRACWSVPVRDAAGATMAAFAMYYRTARRPTDADRQLIERAGRVAGVAIGRVRAEAALRASEERYRLLATNIPEVAWLVDRTGRTIFVSPNIVAVTGYTADEVYAPGGVQWLVRMHPDDRPLVSQQLEALFRDGARFDVEYRTRRRDGRWIWVHDRAVTTYEEQGVAYAYGLLSEITDRKQAEEIRALLLNQVITVQEEERGRIARELHDETAQSLASLLMGLGALQEARTVKAARAQARDLQQVATHALAEVRRLAWGLRPSVLDDLGLATALARYAADFGRTRGITVRVETSGLDDGRLAPAVETALYRIMQEALSNVARHAAATTVSVWLRRRQDAVVLIVDDDGCGFDSEQPPGPATAARGLGIHTMRERAAVLKGTFTIDSAPGRGTRLEVEIPLGTEAT